MTGLPRDRIVTDEEIVELLQKAQAMGFDLEKDSDLEKYTFAEVERMVTVRQ